MTGQPIDHIVILGGGTAGWMTAAALKHHYRHSPIEITLIESLSIGTIGVGEASIPTLRRFYAAMGISDVDIITATKATCKLGIRFNDWKTPGARFIHPFGSFGHDFEGVGFQHYFNAIKHDQNLGNLDDFAIGSALAKAGKFALPSGAANVESYNIYDWALHLDAGLFAKYLTRFAKNLGVNHIDAKLKHVETRAKDGFITGLTLDNGQTISSDLFIDCSGFAALLIEKALGVGYEDYSQWLFCDSAIAVQSERRDAPVPLTEVTARTAGWQWHIPLQHRSGNGHVYASTQISDDDAQKTLMDTLPGKAVTEPRLIRFTPGRRKKAWEKNCIAIGLSSGFLEPLESTSIALIQTGIERIKQLLPDKNCDPVLRDEFNDMSQREFERTRDFIILHYKLTQRTDSDFWRQSAAMNLPDTLAHKIALYQTRGHFVRYRWEMFHPASWLAIYAGFDVWPQMSDPAMSQLTPAVARDHILRIKAHIRETVAKAQPHQNFIDYCQHLSETGYVATK